MKIIIIFILLQKNAFEQKKNSNLMYGFKSAILAIFHFCQKYTFEVLYKKMSQGPPNPGFMKEKVQKGDFQKKSSRELKNYFRFMFL